jgi:hypothetical protein
VTQSVLPGWVRASLRERQQRRNYLGSAGSIERLMFGPRHGLTAVRPPDRRPDGLTATLHNPNVELDETKAQAKVHGTRIMAVLIRRS